MNMTTGIPFKWYLSGFRCFSCHTNFNEPDALRDHYLKLHPEYTKIKKIGTDNNTFKIDTSKIICKRCFFAPDHANKAPVVLDEIVHHLNKVHESNYKVDVKCMEAYKLQSNCYECSICDESYDFFGNLLQHVNKFHPVSCIACGECGEQFGRKANLRSHVLRYHRQGGVPCSECNVKFETYQEYSTHRANEHNSYTCPKCPERFPTTIEKRQHISKFHKEHLQIFKCPVCQKIYPKRGLMRRHVQDVHQRNDNHECVICSRKFLNKEQLTQHLDRHANTENYVCDYCKKQFATKNNLVKHISNHFKKDTEKNNIVKPKTARGLLLDPKTPYGKNSLIRKNILCILNMSTAIPFKWYEGKYRCFYCKNSFSEEHAIQDHTRQQHPICRIDLLRKVKGDHLATKIDISDLRCKLCPKEIINLEFLKRHLVEEHNADLNLEIDDKISPYKLVKNELLCPYCDDRYTFFNQLLIHVNKVHKEQCVICAECGEFFPGYANLRSHQSNHHKRGGHRCEVCELAFASRNKLITHMARVHDYERYCCPHCPEKFKTQYYMQIHLGSKHNYENFKIKCTLCDMIFERKSRMLNHVRRVHNKERTVPCEICGFKFFNQMFLNKHMIVHQGEKNFKCEVCDKAFLRKHNLNSHMDTHRKDGFCCSECGQSFASKGSFKNHKKTHENANEVPIEFDASTVYYNQ